MVKSMAALLVAACFVSASNLTVNGDFELPFTTGWIDTASNLTATFTQATTFDADPNYEACVEVGTAAGYATLLQVVELPSTNVNFSVNAKLYAYDNHASAWTGAAVVLTYLNRFGSRIGSTRICARSTENPWVNTSTMHIIPAADSLWHAYAFNINTELGNLPGINPSDVQQIEVSLFDTTYHC
ncbi:MAG TPA: hypothetical protein VF399_12665 [bacterium]